MISTRQLAREFERRTSFKVTSRLRDKSKGSFFELRNHVHGEPRKAGEPPMMLHLVTEWSGNKVVKLDALLSFRYPPGDFAHGGNHMITAHHDGTLTLEGKRLTPKEVAFALLHAKLLHALMAEKPSTRRKPR